MISKTVNEYEYRLGGELELAGEDFLEPQIIDSNYLQKKHHLFLDTGRSAIYIALQSVIQQGGKREAWLPRYCCKSILLPFKQLGFKLKYYSLGIDLQSPEDLPEKMDGEVFLFIHYFGKRNQVILNYLERMKRQQHFFVIEDCVQSLLNKEIGTHDFAVYSYRKFFPQPDGALLTSDFSLANENILPANETFVSQRLIGKLIRNKGVEGLYLDLFAKSEEIIDNSICPREMSYLSQYLLDRTDPVAIAAKRRDNFFYLTQLLQTRAFDYNLIHPLFDSIENGEVPLGMPVVITPAYRDKIRDFLIILQVYCPIHWPIDTNEAGSWKNELQLSRSLLTLPLDQRIDRYALQYLVGKISSFFERRL